VPDTDQVIDDGSDDEFQETESSDDSSDGLLSYEVSEWSGESRGLLDAMLTSAGIRHVWQGTTLGVDEVREAEVDAIIDEVLATATAGLDPDRDKVVYEVGSWPAGLQQSLAESLAVAEISYEWDTAGDLVVYVDDEEPVEAILEGMPDPDDSDRQADGLDVQSVLSSLWGAARDLAKDAGGVDAVVDLAESADQMELMSLPFGFEPPVWRQLVERAGGLREALDVTGDDSWTDEEINEAAADLRDLVRPYI